MGQDLINASNHLYFDQGRQLVHFLKFFLLRLELSPQYDELAEQTEQPAQHQQRFPPDVPN